MNTWLNVDGWFERLAPLQPPPSRHGQTAIEFLPTDLLLEVVNHLVDRGERLQFALTSTRIYHQVIPSVYASVELYGYQQCENTLQMLCDTPNLARHVQELIVYPDYASHPRPGESDAREQQCISASFLIAKAALSMDALRTFSWHATWGNPMDAMWSTLRRCCPNLKHIGTTFAERLPHPRCPLFAFDDLHSFALTVKPIFTIQGNDLSDPESLPVYNRLWDMLITRCPNLVSLSLESDMNDPVFAQRLLDGSWPLLSTLKVGPARFETGAAIFAQDLIPFLERHPSIEQLSLREILVDFSALPVEGLPNLKCFSGSVDHLRALSGRGQLPNAAGFHHMHVSSPLAGTLQSLTVAELMPLRELTPLAISSMLVGLNALTSLTMVFSLESGYDANGVFRTVVSACPQLLHLDITCTSKPSFYLEAFSRTLKGLTRLRTLSLTIVRVHNDESMQASAIRISHANPRLSRFNLTYIPAQPVLHGRAFRRPEPYREGRFSLQCDAHGIPMKLFAFETYRRFGGLGRRVFKRTICELRPSGHPDVAQKTWTELLLERSPAGEESRLLVLSACLLMLAVWGVAKSVLLNATDAPWRARGLDRL